MKYVLTEDGKAIKLGPTGKVMIDPENGQDFYEMDAINAETRIIALSAEAKEHRTKKAEYKTALEAIPEIIRQDPKKAELAIQTVSSMSEQHKLDVEKLKGEMQGSFDTALAEKETEIGKLKNDLFSEKVTLKFATTPALEKTVFNEMRDVAVTHFKGQFSVDETGNVVGKDWNGQTIYSKENPGNPAKFDEAVTTLINTSPNKDKWLAPAVFKGQGPPPPSGTTDGNKTSQEKIASGLAARKAAA